MEHFLRFTAWQNEVTAKSRTYVLLSGDTPNLLAYYTLSLKAIQLSEEVSGSAKQKMSGGNKRTTEMVVYLIGQLGKNDAFSGQISGKEILGYAVSEIRRAVDAVGGRVILVECEDVHALTVFYEANGFKKLQAHQGNDKKLVQFYYMAV